MPVFLGYFVWGLMLAAPLWWLSWRLRLGDWLPRLRSLMRRRTVRLPSQLQPLVILGKRQHGDRGDGS
jgi:hypothetical protein